MDKTILPRPELAKYIRTLIISATEILINPTNPELVVTFARLLPTVSYTLLALVEAFKKPGISC